MLTIGSVCSGIGGLELGLEAAGLGPTKWQIEIDPYARAVLAKHWPDAVRHEDLRHVQPEQLSPVDIICGGTPCQDLSQAGQRAGIEGSKSSLWLEQLRIVAALRPYFVVWENVAGSIRGGLGRVVSDLRELDYEVVGARLSAADTGGPHERERVFVVAYADRQGQPQQGGAISEVRRRPFHGDKPWPLQPWPAEPAVPRVAHGVPHRTQRDRALGNACTPPQAEVVGWLIRDIADGRATT